MSNLSLAMITTSKSPVGNQKGEVFRGIFPFYRYLKLVKLPAEVQDSVFFFNAFFYQKLLEVEVQKDGCKRPNMEEIYKPVFAWVKSDDIFTKNSLLIPILKR
jgi:Ulp1 family protease